MQTEQERGNFKERLVVIHTRMGVLSTSIELQQREYLTLSKEKELLSQLVDLYKMPAISSNEQERKVTAAIKNGEPILLDPIPMPPITKYKKKSELDHTITDSNVRLSPPTKFRNRTPRVQEMTKLVLEVIRSSPNGYTSRECYAEFKTYFSEGAAATFNQFSNWLHICTKLEGWTYRDNNQLYRIKPVATKTECDKK